MHKREQIQIEMSTETQKVKNAGLGSEGPAPTQSSVFRRLYV